MAFPRLDVVASDLSTVLWSFNDQAGASNPNSVKSKLGPVRFGHTTQINTAENQDAGGYETRYRDALTDGTITFYPKATSEDNLAASLGQLNELLGNEGIMVWQPTSGSPLRYIDFLPSPRFAYLQGQHVPDLKSIADGLTITFVMQPWLRGASVSVGATTIENDPTSGTPDESRIFRITGVTGDLPTPLRLRVNVDAADSPGVERVLVASRARRSLASSVFTETLTDTAFVLTNATNRNWTVTLGTDTTSVADATAAGGNVARVSYSTVTGPARRWRATRTASMDSIRGGWRPQLRVKPSAASRHGITLRWGVGTGDPASFTEDEYLLDVSLATTFDWIEIPLGRLSIPTDATVALSGMALEIHTRRITGTGNLDLNLIWFPPDNVTTLVAPETSPITYEGFYLTTPPYKLTADATWTAGTPAATTGGLEGMSLFDNLDAAGTGPNTGEVWGTGRHIVRFRLYNQFGYTGTGELRVVTVGGGGAGAEVASEAVTSIPSGISTHELIVDDTAGTAAYQAQATQTTAGGTFFVVDITRTKLPVLVSGESFRTDPRRLAVDRLDGSGNLSGYLGVEGEVPAMIHPGDNDIYVRCDDLALLGFPVGENKLTRAPSVSGTYDPRYAL